MTTALTDRMHDLQLDSVDKVKLAHEHDRNDVKVHASAMWYAPRGVTPFTIYTLIVSCPGTKAWWVIQKRFSQFHRLRKQLQKLHAFSTGAIRSLLKDIVKCEFPSRHLGFDTAIIVTERKALLQDFTTKVIALRAACVLQSLNAETTSLGAKLDHIYDIVQRFLEIPDGLRDEDLRHTLSVSSPTCSNGSGSPSTANEDDDESCAICMCSFDANESVLTMACHHSFHEDCIVHWFEEKLTCPLCRDEAVGGHVVGC
ncbi:hypothetical protein SDRG_06903 [Saprolegnia diclina VS20]|uniref:RING-type E3 ubiquitin transferase n=1 Tax=Saprolegnia diclina (strain VS20) TaxID=1156394 RepID=T0QCK4_SAPDV|nr:hypothetical protein SDRG_06903 [Saprolegnia diclina VS20]EQC35619.1 hypothetical protein SDRG_06903 [Saprolegnia diclina VS20]|eukprot:XP_008610936.1 hypothetical protein SDRG_06903 [Saprolegnia diclina VS20]